MAVPKDPAMLLSYVNTQLRDNYPSLEEMCQALGESREEIEKTLGTIDYEYSPEQNRFV
ncbi:MAG TPA: DUF4250 domain-containing protein [Candidatus Lachnoclostridium stercorigallinarum]|uniref:DUF4250 domain-containing protein n=1 Tax=Candidatus Lachnoclostridium stercorigallinarum TaxID=2838634 RepID=A0A9D2GJT4_9FIRM|nr:DUF4250 domain-containing protein [Candidatus Lachnoclostridium stercorigallinarum]